MPSFPAISVNHLLPTPTPRTRPQLGLNAWVIRKSRATHIKRKAIEGNSQIWNDRIEVSCKYNKGKKLAEHGNEREKECMTKEKICGSIRLKKKLSRSISPRKH